MNRKNRTFFVLGVSAFIYLLYQNYRSYQKRGDNTKIKTQLPNHKNNKLLNNENNQKVDAAHDDFIMNNCFRSKSIKGVHICSVNHELVGFVDDQVFLYYKKLKKIISLPRAKVETSGAYTKYICKKRSDSVWDTFNSSVLKMSLSFQKLSVSLFKSYQCAKAQKNDNDCIYYLNQSVDAGHLNYNYHLYYGLINNLTANIEFNNKTLYPTYYNYVGALEGVSKNTNFFR